MIKKISKKALFLAAFLVFAAVFVSIVTCKAPTGSNGKTIGDLEDTPDGSTRLVVAIHDTPFKMQDKTVEALNVTVKQMVIIDSNGKHFTILEEDRSMDILAISRNDPVVLSDVSVEPGVYQELRLVLKDNSTITVDGETHPIKIPSGSQSGLKLKGPFTIPAGKLFRLTIDFVANESVHWNKGQGYMLKPVLRISSSAEIVGIFRGDLTVSDFIGANETLVQLNSDNTARIRVADYPNYSLYCNYQYNSVLKMLIMTNLSLDAPGLRRRALKEVMKKMPEKIELKVTEWSLNSVIAIDITERVSKLYRVDSFDFSDGVSFTEFTLNIEYPDSSMNGKDVITEIRFIDTGMPPKTLLYEFEGSGITEEIRVLNNYLEGDSTRIEIRAYLFESPDDWNIDLDGVYASRTAFLMTGSVIKESTNNPWQPERHIFTLRRDGKQNFQVDFPKRLNIRLEHNNFTNNNPVVRWDPYPNASGYIVMVLVKEQNSNPNKDTISGSDFWAVAFHKYTKDTTVRIYSELIGFVPVDSYGPRINPGDYIRIEVFALDDSGNFDTKNKSGALFMDSINIRR